MAAKRCVIEIGEGTVKAYQGKKAGQAHGIAAIALGPSDEPTVRKLLSGCRECVIAIPRHKAMMRSLVLPARDIEELSDMIGLRLLRDIPYPVEDVIYKFQVLEQVDDNRSRVLVAVVPRETVRTYLELARGLGVRAQDAIVTLSSYGLLGWCRHNPLDQPAAVVDLDPHHSEIAFCADGKLFFSRHLPYGRADVITDCGDEFVKAIRASLAVYQQQAFGPLPQELIILLPFIEGKKLRERLEMETGLPARIAGPWDGLAGLPGSVQAVLSRNGQYSFTGGAGLMPGDPGAWMNFIPGEIDREKTNRLLKYQLFLFIGLMLAAGGITIGGEVAQIRHKARTREALGRQGRGLEISAREAREKINFVKRLDSRFTGCRFVPDIIDSLRRLTPDEAALRTFMLDGEGHLTLQGYARDHSQVNQIQSGLVQAPGFLNVDLKFATNRRIANRNVTDFKIVLDVMPGREAEQ